MFDKILFWFLRDLCLLALRIYNRLSISGREKIPPERPLILAANHTSNMDPVVVGCSFPLKVRPLGKIELFQGNRAFKWLITHLGCIPVSRESDSAAASALKQFLSILKNGENVLIFPEGSRSHDGRLKPIEGGITVLATGTGAPIVPAYIAGTFECMPIGAKFIKPHKIRVRFGNPIYPLPKEQRKSLKEERERIRIALQDELARLEKESIG